MNNQTHKHRVKSANCGPPTQEVVHGDNVAENLSQFLSEEWSRGDQQTFYVFESRAQLDNPGFCLGEPVWPSRKILPELLSIKILFWFKTKETLRHYFYFLFSLRPSPPSFLPSISVGNLWVLSRKHHVEIISSRGALTHPSCQAPIWALFQSVLVLRNKSASFFVDMKARSHGIRWERETGSCC